MAIAGWQSHDDIIAGGGGSGSSVWWSVAFVAGLMLHATIAHYLAGQEIEVSLKWPNDVLVEGAKISGILLETASTGQGGRIGWLLGWGWIWRGITRKTRPAPATSLAAYLSQVPDNLAALGKLAEHFDRYFKIWQQQGFPAIADAWQQQARNLGAANQRSATGKSDAKGYF